jgi:hypothetical protein
MPSARAVLGRDMLYEAPPSQNLGRDLAGQGYEAESAPGRKTMSAGHEDVGAKDFALDRIVQTLDRANRDRMLKAKFSEADDARKNLEETPTSSAPAWSRKEDSASRGINYVWTN